MGLLFFESLGLYGFEFVSRNSRSKPGSQAIKLERQMETPGLCKTQRRTTLGGVRDVASLPCNIKEYAEQHQRVRGVLVEQTTKCCRGQIEVVGLVLQSRKKTLNSSERYAICLFTRPLLAYTSVGFGFDKWSAPLWAQEATPLAGGWDFSLASPLPPAYYFAKKLAA